LGPSARKCRHASSEAFSLVGAEFGGVGLSGLEPLTSALSGGLATQEMHNPRGGRVLGSPSLSAGRCGGRLPDWLPRCPSIRAPSGKSGRLPLHFAAAVDCSDRYPLAPALPVSRCC